MSHYTRKKSKNLKLQKGISICATTIMCLFVYFIWVMIVIQFCGYALGDKIEIPLALLILAPLGLAIMALSNYLPVTKQNKTFGIRTSATVKNEECWRLTHQFAGLMGMIAGLLIIIFSVIFTFTNILWLLIIGIVFSILLGAVSPVIYSYIILNKIQKQNGDEVK